MHFVERNRKHGCKKIKVTRNTPNFKVDVNALQTKEIPSGTLAVSFLWILTFLYKVWFTFTFVSQEYHICWYHHSQTFIQWHTLLMHSYISTTSRQLQILFMIWTLQLHPPVAHCPLLYISISFIFFAIATKSRVFFVKMLKNSIVSRVPLLGSSHQASTLGILENQLQKVAVPIWITLFLLFWDFDLSKSINSVSGCILIPHHQDIPNISLSI